MLTVSSDNAGPTVSGVADCHNCDAVFSGARRRRQECLNPWSRGVGPHLGELPGKYPGVGGGQLAAAALAHVGRGLAAEWFLASQPGHALRLGGRARRSFELLFELKVFEIILPEIRDLYADFHIDIVRVGRAINRDASKRGKVNEVVVRNYR